VRNASSRFTIGPHDAYIGIVDFSAPDSSCCKGQHLGWYSCACNDDVYRIYFDEEQCKNVTVRTCVKGHPFNCKKWEEHVEWQCKNETFKRFIDDCQFDEKCNNITDNTAEVLVELNDTDVLNKITKIRKMDGHTCQRYGLIEAYKMIFERNTRCSNDAVNRSGAKCPIPIVIVVTDGEDLCHTSTEQWANIIKEKDDRGLLIEVGVGLHSNFDKQFIKNLSSNIVGYEYGLTVDDYDKIKDVLDSLITPVCEIGQIGGNCGPQCGGFCACGGCACPMCPGHENCKQLMCTTAENGCQEFNYSCPESADFDPFCYSMECVPGEEDVCEPKKRKCEEEFPNLAECQYAYCAEGMGCRIGAKEGFCAEKAAQRGLCWVGLCDPEAVGHDEDGCVIKRKNCNTDAFPGCTGVKCNEETGNCQADWCPRKCYSQNETGEYIDNCAEEARRRFPDEGCVSSTCNPDATGDDICSFTHMPKTHENMCKIYVCNPVTNKAEVTEFVNETCRQMENECYRFTCDVNMNNGMGGCKAQPKKHTYDFDITQDLCNIYSCDNKTGWYATPVCSTLSNCTTSLCRPSDGTCSEEPLSCTDLITVPNDCMQAVCKEGKGCTLKRYSGAYIDICGNCIRTDPFGKAISDGEEYNCVELSDEPLTKEGLAAAAIALIVLGAIILGALIAVSGVMGTKALIDRARGASNQAVVSNPLFEESQTEMSNPAFVGETI